MTNNKLNPDWATGFIDGEGCFRTSLTKSKDRKIKWKIYLSFQIRLHIKDKDLLVEIKSFFNNIGKIYTRNTSVDYVVRSLDEITKIIIPHFNKYPLLTQKQSDFLLWKTIAELMNKGEHLTEDGLVKIINLKASLNKGLSNNLKLYFPNVIGIERSIINPPININYNWIAGFFSAEGCFLINIRKALDNKIGYSIYLRVSVNQHIRDRLLLKALTNVINCGNVYKHSKDAIVYMVFKFEDINNKIIPLFNEYDIKGIKSLDFQDFCEAAKLINEKIHLTEQGLKKIILIKSKMNKARYFN